MNLFKSYVIGGFECSTHRNSAGKRIDVIAATEHDRYAKRDYKRLLETGMQTARDGTRWHLIEKSPYEYDWSSVINQVRAARETKIQVIWDLFHYGYPDDLDILSPQFIDRFSAFAAEFTKLLVSESNSQPLLCLTNENSFFAWAAGEAQIFHPFLKSRGDDLKRQLVRAAIAAAERIKEVAPDAKLIITDPVVRVLPSNLSHQIDAENFHNAQYHAMDMMLGRVEPEIGGAAKYCDIIGVNYYSYNQWRHPSGDRVQPDSEDYQPFSEILIDYYRRYQKPLFVAETGIEDEARSDWFRYICEEVRIAENAGIPIYGVCLYPILNHPGWDDDRHCYNGLWDYPDEHGEREIYAPLADEIRRQQLIRKNILLSAPEV